MDFERPVAISPESVESRLFTRVYALMGMGLGLTALVAWFTASTPALYEAVVEGTEEAIVNALCAADDMEGPTGHVAPALPLARLTEILTRYRAVFHAPSA